MVQLNDLNNSLKSYTEREIRILLEREGRALKQIAVKEWMRYLQSYRPKQYVRTYKSVEAIKLGRVQKMIDGTFGIELTWENDLAYHDSVVKGSNKRGHAIMLISDGWHSAKLEKKIGRREHFTYYEGSGYLYKVYKAYMARKPEILRLDVQWSGKVIQEGR